MSEDFNRIIQLLNSLEDTLKEVANNLILTRYALYIVAGAILVHAIVAFIKKARIV